MSEPLIHFIGRHMSAAPHFAEEIEALERLLKIAKSDTGQSGRVANFLLAWWNASRDGGFDLTDLWNVDRAIADDMIKVFSFVAHTHHYPDSLGLGAVFEQMVTDWRRPKRARARR
jgi:hypothetical protein